jgi:hypothetical protein
VLFEEMISFQYINENRLIFPLKNAFPLGFMIEDPMLYVAGKFDLQFL